MPTALDHVVLAVTDLDAASASFEKLGLKLSHPGEHPGQGTKNRVIFVVQNDGVEFYVELLAVRDESEARAAGLDSLVDKVAAGGGILRLMLRTDDIDGIAGKLDAGGHAFKRVTVLRNSGTPIGDVLRPEGAPAGCEIGIIQYAENLDERLARHRANGMLDHAFPLKRADHVAMITPNPEPVIDFWANVLGLPVTGTIDGGPMKIYQILAGDIVVELLAPATPDSPIASRPPGLASVVAYEVPVLDEAIAAARAARFTAPDGEAGVIPGTRRSSIPAGETAGLTVQLLEYV